MHQVTFIVFLLLRYLELSSTRHSSTMRTFRARKKLAVAKPSATQAKWLDFELGSVIHFNMQTFDRQMSVGG